MDVKDRLKSKYIDPFTDFGFKRLFGEDCNKELYRDFKNSIDTARDEGRDEGRAEGEQERLKLQQKIEEDKKMLAEKDKEIAELKRLYGIKQ